MFLTIEQVAERYGVSVASVKRWKAAGLLPAPVRLGRRTLRWLLSDLEAMEKAARRAANRDENCSTTS